MQTQHDKPYFTAQSLRTCARWRAPIGRERLAANCIDQILLKLLESDEHGVVLRAHDWPAKICEIKKAILTVKNAHIIKGISGLFLYFSTISRFLVFLLWMP